MDRRVRSRRSRSSQAADAERGIFVKNYIDQSQEFALCAVALAYPIVTLLRAKRILPALLLVALALGFVVNMAFVIVSRTALVTMPIMLAVFALLHLKWRSIVDHHCARRSCWRGWPGRHRRSCARRSRPFVRDYQMYKERDRRDLDRPAAGILAKIAAVFCRGAGRSGTAPDRRAGCSSRPPSARRSAGAEVIGNPHNQTLNVAVQWGVIGIVVLYAMWLLHLLLFRGDGLAAWIGLLVVVQNIFTSLFNSHMFDFHEGWMYVLGVGVAGGMVLKAGAARCRAGTGNSVRS